MLFDSDILSASSVVGGILLLSMMSKLFEVEKKKDRSNASAAKDLIHQYAEWKRVGDQDKSDVYRLRHSALALAYLQAARACCSDEMIQRTTGIDIFSEVREAESSLRKRTQTLSKSATGSNSNAPHRSSTSNITWL